MSICTLNIYRFHAKPSKDRSYTPLQLLAALKRKTKGSLIFVSHCRTISKREDVIRELGRYTEITVRGKCEKQLSVNNSLGSEFCKSNCGDDDLIATHRFYLAFENSICDEYITEKFYVRITELLVPVVLERKIYTDTGIPPDSFIAADDFNSVAELGEYLNYLRKNDTAYLRYFAWTQYYRKPIYQTSAMCNLCEDIYKGKKIIASDINKSFNINDCH
ncbi:unnamed protein product [Cylicocyclus nassatus]|uniref:Fucosyltransferase n=1 Tax=Cylicocyclus nassatus TaxID=53992 RepID=A0AA36GDZ3_CYLNA|nr:unnamed protein product [Cylicocyclus nassatus]